MENTYISTENLDAGYGKEVLIRQICLHVKRGEIVTHDGGNE